MENSPQVQWLKRKKGWRTRQPFCDQASVLVSLIVVTIIASSRSTAAV